MTAKAKAKPKATTQKPMLTVSRPGPHGLFTTIKVSGGALHLDDLDTAQRLASNGLPSLFQAIGLNVEFLDDVDD